MEYTVEYTDEFGALWAGFSQSQQEDIAAMVGLLEERGPHLPFPLQFGHCRIAPSAYA